MYETVGRFYKPAAKAGPARPIISAAAEKAPPQGVAETPRADELDIPAVEGLNAADGLLRVFGNRKLYLKLLRQFCVQHAEAPAQIAELLKAGDRTTAERTAHTFKGVAANLGAKTVQSAAGDLEKALREGSDPVRLDSLHHQFASVLTPFVDRLRAALGEEPAVRLANTGIAVDPEALKQVVAQMSKHLAEFDAAASDCLEANRSVFASLFCAEDFVRFEQQVQDYAFGEAQAQLEQATRTRSRDDLS
jgi:HPt (histidine-containing phosphotransfer) domain-containing protein